MDLGLNNKVALVAAASRGLGRAVAEELAAEGASLIICSRKQETIEHVANEIKDATGANIIGVAADVSNPSDVSRLVKAMKAKLPIAIAIPRGLVSASCARGIAVEPMSPAAARVNACIALRTAGRFAATTITMPRRMTPGTWGIGIVDMTPLRVHGSQIAGKPELRLATFGSG